MIVIDTLSRSLQANAWLNRAVPIRTLKSAYIRLLVPLLFSLMASVSIASAESPIEGYFRFQQGVSKATTLQEALPYLSPEYRAMLESRPADSHVQWLERLKSAANKSDIKVVKETINGKSAVLDVTGTDSEGTPLRGKISLVSENDMWLLDEQGWSS